MGVWTSKLFDAINGAKECRVMMLGLDAAGKTTILYKLRLGEVVQTIPTIGFNVETVEYKNVNFTLWDIGPRERITQLLRHYYSGTQGIIYVVDSNDRERTSDSREELHTLLTVPELQTAPLLVLANKQDLPHALSASELTDRLGLHGLRERQWHIQASSAVSGDGLYEGLEWLTQVGAAR